MAVPLIDPVPPVPRIALPNPHFRKPSLSTQIADEDSIRNSGAFDPSVPVPKIPREHQNQDSISSDIGQVATEYSPIDGASRSLNSSSAAQKYTPKQATNLRHASPQSKSSDSGYLSSSSPGTSKSAVVPIRSMFPVYNPSVSLQQQQYYPQRPQAVRKGSPGSQMTRQESPYFASTPPQYTFGTPSALKSVANFPLDNATHHVSTATDLLDLWEATQGMEPTPRIRSYDLELARTEEAIFTLGPTPDAPFYSMTTYDTNEIALSKVFPRKRTLKCEVSINSIEPPARRAPPNDGLVTFIFPKMAAMLAINQSTALANAHELAPTHRDEVQAAAVKRAAKQEACKLRWNAHVQNYELEHPAIGRRAKTPEFIKSPTQASPQIPEDRPALDIYVTVPVGRSLPTVSVANPKVSDVESSGPSMPGIRMSTLAQSDSDQSLIFLDFNTRIMHINANQILEQVPSLFAIDSLVSAVMTVAIADAMTHPVMAGIEIWEPKPSQALSTYGGSMAGKSKAGSVFYATLAEREDAEAEARELAEIHERDIRNQGRKKQHKKWFGRDKSQKTPKTKKVTIKEFDLEKLGHYQSGNRKGQELPGVVRVLLSIMVGGLRFVVWILTAIVHCLTWILVTCTRGVTSDRF